MQDPTSVEMMLLLRRIADQLEAIPKALAALQRGNAGSLSKQDRQVLSELLPAISEAVGDAIFTTRELVEDSDPKLDIALTCIGGRTGARRLGKLLARADGFAQDGLSVQSTGKARDGVLWRVMQV